MNGDATGPLVLPDWEQWGRRHLTGIHIKMEIQENLVATSSEAHRSLH